MEQQVRINCAQYRGEFNAIEKFNRNADSTTV